MLLCQHHVAGVTQVPGDSGGPLWVDLGSNTVKIIGVTHSVGSYPLNQPTYAGQTFAVYSSIQNINYDFIAHGTSVVSWY